VAAGQEYDHRSEWLPSPRWVRVRFAGQTVADSTAVMLLRQHGFLPVYYFPERHVRTDLLEPSRHVTFSPYKGTAHYFDVRVGPRVAQASAWTYPAPRAGSPDTRGYYSFHWHGMDAWLEEDEIVSVHPRDPYVRAETLSSSQHVVVRLRGQVVAETARPVLLLETGLVPRYYIPPADVAMECFEPAPGHSMCPYKGTARYLNYQHREVPIDGAAWYYPAPLRDVVKIAGHICFWNERADTTIEVDGAQLPHLGIRPGGPGGEPLYPSRRFFLVPPPVTMRDARPGQLQHDFARPNGRAEGPPDDLIDMAVERAGGRLPGLQGGPPRIGAPALAGGAARPGSSLFFTFGRSAGLLSGEAGQPSAAGHQHRASPDPAAMCAPALRRVRALKSGVVLADSRDAILYASPQGAATYYFPAGDVRRDLLDTSAETTSIPGVGLAARFCVKGQPAPVAFSPAHPPPGLGVLRGRFAFEWNAIDTWLEEDDEVRGHPRVPYHRVDAVASGRHVAVRLAGTLLAESRRPVAVFETGQPARFYLLRADIAMHLLTPDGRRTESPYLGTAVHYSARAGEALHADVAWSYEDPIPECPKITGLICFDDSRVRVEAEASDPGIYTGLSAGPGSGNGTASPGGDGTAGAKQARRSRRHSHRGGPSKFDVGERLLPSLS
jgi:uncharacterized protein (DUF427 family)